MNRTRVQVVVAHPDDETFACGSLLLHAAAAGAETAVCCGTRGEAGELRPGTTGSSSQMGLLRESELRAAAAAVGVSRVDLLGFTDSGMSGPPASGSLVGVRFDHVVEAVADRLAAFQPDVVVTLDGSDGHRDHERIREAAIAAARLQGVPRIYVHCLPRSLMRRWLAYMHRDRPSMEHLGDGVQVLGTPDEDVTTVIDTSPYLPARERAIALHASQTSPFEGLPEELRRAFLATDHLRRVQPPWEPDGPRESDIFG